MKLVSILRRTTSLALLGGAALCVGAPASAAIIFNTGVAGTATVAMGINDEGHLNTRVGNIAVNAGATGLAFKFADGSWRDATAPGCLCEGWGVSVNNTTSGYANVDSDSGVNNLSVVGVPAATPSTFTTTTAITSLPGLTVRHAYAPADNSPEALFKVVVTIRNETGVAVNDVKYVRVMDWDVPPTEFAEYVSIRGTATTTLLERSHNDGFETANPLVDGAPITAATLNADFEDLGVLDHGAYFRFNFGTLEDLTEYTFTIFYGAAPSERTALLAMGAEDIELYSIGQSSGAGGAEFGTPATFIFGFAGVGGDPVITPEPGSLALLGFGLMGLGFARRRRA